MMFIVYSALLYVFAVFYLPYMAVRLALRGKVRAGIRQRFGVLDKSFSNTGEGKTVWVHAVSVGETLAAVPIVKALKERRPGLKVFFSTVTETGSAVARQGLSADDSVFFFPFDFPCVVRRVVGRIRPDVFVVVETEIWPNLIRELHRKGIPAVMVNGRISARSFKRYRKAKFFMARVLGLMARMNMQSVQDAERINDMGAPPERVSVVGNIKFDQAYRPVRDGGGELMTRAKLGIPDASLVMVAGSTHKGEEEEVVAAYRGLVERFPGVCLILAPRHPERLPEVKALLEKNGLDYVLRSAILPGRVPAPGIILLDTMGELAGIYRVGDINFVGGSWAPVGGHNVLEPIAFGKPVFFGPHMHNFSEISRILKDCGVGIEVKDGQELAREAIRLLQEPERMEALTRAAKEALLKNRGALDRNVELIEGYLH